MRFCAGVPNVVAVPSGPIAPVMPLTTGPPMNAVA